MIPIKLSSQLQIGQWVTLSSHKDLICIEDEKMLAAVREDFEIGGLMEGYWNSELEALTEMRGWWKNNKEEEAIIDFMIAECSSRKIISNQIPKSIGKNVKPK